MYANWPAATYVIVICPVSRRHRGGVHLGRSIPDVKPAFVLISTLRCAALKSHRTRLISILLRGFLEYPQTK